MSPTVIMGGPPDLGLLSLPDATLGRCEDCSTKIVYKGLAPAEYATVCVKCAARRFKSDRSTVILGPSGERRMIIS